MKRENFIASVIISFFICFMAVWVSGKEKTTLPPQYKKWMEEEVVYIITPAEKEVFYKLETDRERDLFIKEFWRQRDPMPGTPKNEFKEEHYRRIDHVKTTRMWLQPKLKNSWRTDRGRIYITLGEPQQIARFSDTEVHPAEIWYYQGNPRHGQPGQFSLLFFKRYGSGEFELYNPITDGPRSLTPLSWMCGGCSTDDDYDKYAYALIRVVSVELAAASLSSFPGQGMSLDNAWALRMPSTILMSEVHTYPHKKVEDEYAYEFLEHKASVEVSYSAYYIGNRSRVDVIQDPSGEYFVNYAVEPETLSIDLFENSYLTNLKATIRVTNTEEKTIFQQERNFSIEMKKDQVKKIKERPFHLYDNFPLIPGNYRFNLLLENTVSKEFTSLEKDLWVPEPGSFFMGSLILTNRINPDSPYGQANKAFKIGNLQIYPSLEKRFYQKDKMHLFFQIIGLNPSLQENGILEFVFYRGEEPFQTRKKKLIEYRDKQNILEEISLEEFPPGHYLLKVSFLDEEGKCTLSSQEEFSVDANPLPESWVMSHTYPCLEDPIYSVLLGNQYFNNGDLMRGCDEMERAYSAKPDSVEYALNFARVLLSMKEYEKIKEVLSPFLDKPVQKYTLYKFLGIAHQGLEEYEKAIDYYLEYISHEGASFDVLNSVALCHYQLGRNGEALRAWEKSLEMNPKQEEIKEVIKILKEKIKRKK
ncbi:MAG: GWxTD domain-containing protein [Candidatus Aminicenantes bacterium]